MSSNCLLKIRLVSKSGLSLAEYPQDDDITKSQLAGGIMSALLSFSKEVHNKDLESLSFDDRNLFFLPIHEFFLILEILKEANSELVRNLVEEIRASAHVLLHDYDEENLNSSIADNLLEKLANLSETLQMLSDIGDLKNKYFLGETRIVKFEINLNNNTNNIISSYEDNEYALQISNMILNGNLELIDRKNCRIGIVKLEKSKEGALVISKIKNDIISVGCIIIKDENCYSLMALSNKLIEKLKSIVKGNYDTSIDELIKTAIENSNSIKFDIAESKREYISLNTFNKSVKDVEKAIYCTMIGEKVIVAGERALVKIILNTLSLFSLHRSVEVNDWYTGDKSEIDLTGMSLNEVGKLMDEGIIDDSFTIINLNNGKINSPIRKKNKYLKKIFENQMNNDFSTVMKTIKSVLTEIYELSFDLTKFMVINSKKDIINEISKTKKESKDDSKFDLIQSIALNLMNPWLNDILNDQSFDEVWL